ncbi:MAG: DNA mismatch repair endonuclease MutL [Candidatus Goldiibacteriota bacterium]
MKSAVNILPENVANQIAAGEVIIRPASCVKELVENSLDAQADDISIHILEAGKKLIEVRDNGRGMRENDAEKAFLRHATSKISDTADLQSIRSFGFRGEALAAASSVSRMEIITKDSAGSEGIRLKIEKSAVVSRGPAAVNTGTVVKIKDLFYNTPARRKFLKADYTEEAHIIGAVSAMALANEQAGFRLFINKKEVMVIPKNSPLKERIRIIYGRETADSLIEIGEYADDIKITGFAGAPGAALKNRNKQFFFVNKRPVSGRAMSFAVYEGYGTLLMKGRYPAVFIFMDIDPALVDVNVHPAKAEIKFRNERAVFSSIRRAVFSAMNSNELSKSVRDIKTSQETGAPGNEKYQGAGPAADVFETEGKAAPEAALFEEEKISVSDFARAEAGSKKRDYLRMNIIGQVKETYILGEDAGNLILIDQHAAHEKVLYEKIMKDIKERKMKVQEVLIPEIIELTREEKKVFENNRGILSRAGFEVEEFGESEYKISAHPVVFKNKETAPAVKEIISKIMEHGGSEREGIFKEMADTMACRAAIKGGDRLSSEEIKALLDEYFEIEEPFSCPHGRPVIVKVSFGEIEKMFKRKV